MSQVKVLTFWLSSLTSGKVAKEILRDMKRAIYCKLYVVALFILNTWPQVGRSSSWGCPRLFQSADCNDLPHVCASAPYACSWSLARVLLPHVYELTCLTSVPLSSVPLFSILEASPFVPTVPTRALSNSLQLLVYWAVFSRLKLLLGCGLSLLIWDAPVLRRCVVNIRGWNESFARFFIAIKGEDCKERADVLTY